ERVTRPLQLRLMNLDQRLPQPVRARLRLLEALLEQLEHRRGQNHAYAGELPHRVTDARELPLGALNGLQGEEQPGVAAEPLRLDAPKPLELLLPELSHRGLRAVRGSGGAFEALLEQLEHR